MAKNYYITSTLPYVNAEPHVGLALEVVQADALARHQRLLGNNVLYNFGTDEHGLKIYRKALEAKKDPQKYADEYAKKYDNLKKSLNLSYDHFIRTTDKHHKKAAQEFWKICDKNGYIYKKDYETKYCVGCELEKTDSELENGKCTTHPSLDVEIIREENYFFKFSQFEKELLKLYKNNPDFVVPDFRLKEIETFIKKGLQDFSISRLKEKLPWGVSVPGDPDHVMYVWFDALINYISTIGWPENKKEFKRWWPVVQCAGKDNLRQQSAIWQAMLASVGLPFSKQIFIHGFISSGGERISKSLGNVVDPYVLVNEYGTDALRYYLLAKIHPFKDSDFTIEIFEKTYQADLANGLGNLVARVARLCEINDVNIGKADSNKLDKFVTEAIGQYRFDWALEEIWKKISSLDVQINKHELWVNTKSKQHILADVVESIRQIAYDLKPFLPETAEKINKQFRGPKIKATKALFPRLN
jgi:methionyl-tRNA synthetase